MYSIYYLYLKMNLVEYQTDAVVTGILEAFDLLFQQVELFFLKSWPEVVVLDVLPDRGWVWQVQETNRADVVVHPEAEVEEDSGDMEILLLEDDPLRPTIRSGGCLVQVAMDHDPLPLVAVLVVELGGGGGGGRGGGAGGWVVTGLLLLAREGIVSAVLVLGSCGGLELVHQIRWEVNPDVAYQEDTLTPLRMCCQPGPDLQEGLHTLLEHGSLLLLLQGKQDKFQCHSLVHQETRTNPLLWLCPLILLHCLCRLAAGCWLLLRWPRIHHDGLLHLVLGL